MAGIPVPGARLSIPDLRRDHRARVPLARRVDRSPAVPARARGTVESARPRFARHQRPRARGARVAGRGSLEQGNRAAAPSLAQHGQDPRVETVRKARRAAADGSHQPGARARSDSLTPAGDQSVATLLSVEPRAMRAATYRRRYFSQT